jgi:hypothetical protein
MSFIKLIWTLLKRDFVPANDGRKSLLHKLTFYFLPTIGVLMLLIVIAFIGLWLAAEEQSIEHNLKEAKESPYMAIFAEGYLYNQNMDTTRAGSDYNPERWKALKLKELFLLNLSDSVKETSVFKGVYPFSTAYLNIKTKNGQHMDAKKGMAIDFINPENRNDGLIEKIKDDAGDDWTWRNIYDVNGIIASKSMMELLGWTSGDMPKYLWVRTSRYDDKEIPLKLTVVKRLPYYDYILPMQEWRRLESRFYYKKAKHFDIGFPSGYIEEEKNLIKEKLPKESKISSPFIKGDIDTIRIELPANHNWTKADVIEAMQIGYEKKREVSVGESGGGADIEKFGGAILYLNPDILSEDMFKLGLLQNLKKLLEKHDSLKVRGELIQILEKAWEDQQHLERIMDFFSITYMAISGILILFFSLVLHTRLHRIGVLKMIGLPNFLFLMVYFIEALIFVIIAFGLANAGFQIFKPEGLQFNILRVQTFDILKRMIISSEFGFLLPSLWFLSRLRPAEMVSYRSG